jgi:hypothetical protein
MRENRLYGSEGRGRRKPIPTPISSSLTFPAVHQRSSNVSSHTKGTPPMNEYESLSHTTWDCKYHVVFIPKCRRKTLYQELRRHLAKCSASSRFRRTLKLRKGRTFGVDHATLGWLQIQGAASATPPTASSGSRAKAPGSAGGYLLGIAGEDDLDAPDFNRKARESKAEGESNEPTRRSWRQRGQTKGRVGEKGRSRLFNRHSKSPDQRRSGF